MFCSKRYSYVFILLLVSSSLYSMQEKYRRFDLLKDVATLAFCAYKAIQIHSHIMSHDYCSALANVQLLSQGILSSGTIGIHWSGVEFSEAQDQNSQNPDYNSLEKIENFVLGKNVSDIEENALVVIQEKIPYNRIRFVKNSIMGLAGAFGLTATMIGGFSYCNL